MLTRIHHSESAEIVLIVKNASPVATATRGLLQKIRKNWHRLFYVAIQKLERRLYKPLLDPFEPKQLNELLQGVESISVLPTQTKFSDQFPQSDVDAIRGHGLDVLVRLGFRILRGDILKAAKYGVWSFHHGDNRVNRGSPPGFWEVFERWPVTGSILQILTEDMDGGLVLYRSYSQTDKLYVGRNLVNLYWKSLSFLPRKLEQLSQLGAEEFFARVNRENRHPSFYSKRLFKEPAHGQVFWHALTHYAKYVLGEIRKYLFIEKWILLYHFRDGSDPSSSFWRYKKLRPPKNKFWADPFVVFHEDQYHVFFEELPFETGIGHISHLVLGKSGVLSQPKKVLTTPYHLSYPFIFEFEGVFYMIPETAQNRTIELYRCTEFPEKWEFVGNLMEDVYAVDTTLVERDGKWWLFANMRENEGASSLDELFLFYADSPLSNRWEPHPMNPVVSDMRSSRPAGKLFEYKGALYRPSQNSTHFYGYGLNINFVETLTTTEYMETVIEKIEPNWDKEIKGTHTYNRDNGLTIIDGLTHAFHLGKK